MTDLNALIKKRQAENRGQADKSIPADAAQAILNTVREIPVARIHEDASQPRKDYNADKIKALAESITEKGLIQPIIVKPDGRDYIIIAGHRRYRAYMQLKRDAIPCIVREGLLTESDLTELALIENLQREDLNALEIAESIYTLKKIRAIKQRELASVTGYSEGNISKYIQLFEAVKDDEKKQARVIAYGFKRAYTKFCADKNRPKQEPKATGGQSFLIEVADISDGKQVAAAIAKAEKVIAYLRGLLK